MSRSVIVSRGPHALRQARRRPRGPPGDRARLDRDQGGDGADRARGGRARVHDHGPGAPGRRRPGARAPGCDRRRPAEGDAGRHDQQGLRLVDPCRPDRGRDGAGGRCRGDRHRRDGVDVERAVPAQEGAVRLPARPRRAARLDDLRRAHRRLRLAAHGPAQLTRVARARDQPRGAGCLGAPLTAARGRRAGRGALRGRARAGRRRHRRRVGAPRHDRRVAREAEARLRPRGDDDRRQRSRRQRRRLVRRSSRPRSSRSGAGSRPWRRSSRRAGSPTSSRTSCGRRRTPPRRRSRRRGRRSTTSSASRSTRRSPPSRSTRPGCWAPTRRSST